MSRYDRDEEGRLTGFSTEAAFQPFSFSYINDVTDEQIREAIQRFVDYCKNNNIIVEAYSPIAHGRALNNLLIKQMSEKYNTSVPSLCIAYTLQLGLVSLPKAKEITHMKDNIKEIDFVISDRYATILTVVSYPKYNNYC